MLGKLKAWFTTLSTAGKVGVIAAVGVIGVAAAHSGTPSTNQTSKVQTASTCKATLSSSTETQTIAYTSSTVNDDALAQGQTKVTTPGVNGQKQIKHEVTTYSPTGCKPNTNIVVDTNVTKQPVNQVMSVGTYVAPSKPPSSTATSTGSCYPTASSGNCYEPGEYCSNADHGMSGVAGDGKPITCEDNNGWRWEP